MINLSSSDCKQVAAEQFQRAVQGCWLPAKHVALWRPHMSNAYNHFTVGVHYYNHVAVLRELNKYAYMHAIKHV